MINGQDTPSILIVDDRPLNLQILGNLLKEEQYRISVATSGPKALEIIEKGIPDCILLDIEMPGMSGYDVCHVLKKNPETRDVPVIFLTAKNTAEDIVAGFSSGAVDYITKPFNKEELLARVKTHIELKRSREEISLAYEELKIKEGIISNDLKKAREIQTHVISFDRNALSGLDLSVLFLPLIEVGGDIYDVVKTGEDNFRIFIADANGHGVQAALLTMLIKNEYDKIKGILHSPSEIMTQLNNIFHGKYYRLVVLFTACIIDMDGRNGRITVSNAGHPYPYRLSHSGLTRIKVMGPMVGVKQDAHYHNEEHPFCDADTLLLFSDGIYEDLMTKTQNIKMDVIEDIFKRQTGLNAVKCVGNIAADISAVLDGAPVNDDMTLLAIRLSNRRHV